MHPHASWLSLPTQPASKLSEGDQVLAFLVQQREGAVRQRVSVLVWAPGPRHQQPVQALELGPVQPVLPLDVGATRFTVVPRRCLRRRHRAAVTPVQTDEVLRLEGWAVTGWEVRRGWSFHWCRKWASGKVDKKIPWRGRRHQSSSLETWKHPESPLSAAQTHRGRLLT